jgi:tellurite resistance protein
MPPAKEISAENAMRILKSGIDVASADNDLRQSEATAILDMGKKLGMKEDEITPLIEEARKLGSCLGG